MYLNFRLSATVLARAIANEGFNAVAAGLNPQELRVGIQRGVTAALAHLDSIKKEVTTTEEIRQVATISANGDTVIGNLIAEAMEKVGRHGVITVKNGETLEDHLEVTEGMKFDRGYISPFFVNDKKGKGCVRARREECLGNGVLDTVYCFSDHALGRKTHYTDALVLFCEKKLSNVQDLLPALELSHGMKK